MDGFVFIVEPCKEIIVIGFGKFKEQLFYIVCIPLEIFYIVVLQAAIMNLDYDHPKKMYWHELISLFSSQTQTFIYTNTFFQMKEHKEARQTDRNYCWCANLYKKILPNFKFCQNSVYRREKQILRIKIGRCCESKTFMSGRCDWVVIVSNSNASF